MIKTNGELNEKESKRNENNKHIRENNENSKKMFFFFYRYKKCLKLVLKHMKKKPEFIQ